MIPILFDAAATVFSTNGLGALSDAATCTVTEERNGQFELEMTYPVTGIHYAELAEERIILAVPSDGADAQPFRIYSITRPLDGIVTVNAQHISYDLKTMVVRPFRASSAAAAMAGIAQNIAGSCPYTFWTDKQTQATMQVDAPVECRSLLGGIQGSVLDVYGGEYAFDGFTVRLYEHRGEDRGVTIRYGRDLTGLEAETDYSGVYTAAVPYWQKEDQVVIGNKVESGHSGEYTREKCVTLDFSADYEEAPTAAQLEAAALAYMQRNATWEPRISVDVDFVPLWQTEEYAAVAPLQRVHLCDTVAVECPDLAVTVHAQVTQTVYDVLAERYETISLGNARTSLAETITRGTATTEQLRQSSSMLERAILAATEMIRGGLGGYVVINTDADGHPNELLIMDKPSISEAVHVWRWNMGGLGYSEKGYNGQYRTAITADGHFVADFIDTGTLTAALIKAGILSDQKGYNFWDMETGEFRMAATSTVGGKTVNDIAKEKADSAVNDFVSTVYDPKVAELQKQLDGQIETYYYDYEPSLLNEPASGWETEEDRKKHEGDLFYWKSKGYAYRFFKDGNSWKWQLVKDTDVTKALTEAAAAQDTADNKRRVFVSQPTPPYDVGDLWFDGATADIMTCMTKRESGNYSSGDWQKRNKYIDKSTATTEAENAVKGQTQKDIFDKLTDGGKIQGLYMQDGQLYINATYILTGELNADLVKIINLIADHLVSKSGDMTLDAWAAVLKCNLRDRLTVRMYTVTPEYYPEGMGIVQVFSGNVTEAGGLQDNNARVSYVTPQTIAAGEDRNGNYDGNVRCGEISASNRATVNTLRINALRPNDSQNTLKTDWKQVQGTDGNTYWALVGTTLAT